MKYLWQAALDKGKNLEQMVDGEIKKDRIPSAEQVNHGSESVELVASQMNELTVSPPSESIECLNPGGGASDIDKKIRALKKKVLILMLLFSLGMVITDFLNIIIFPRNSMEHMALVLFLIIIENVLSRQSLLTQSVKVDSWILYFFSST